MSPPALSLEQIFADHLRVLATTLRPNTQANYRKVTRCFLAYLRATFPRVRKLSQLRRDPHLLGWFRSLCQHQPPLGNESRLAYLLWLRRLLLDLADNGHLLQPDLIRRQDFPPRTLYLPRPLSLQDDQNLQAQLRQLDDLESNLLLLVRFTGIRIGECIDLSLDCLRQVSPDQWALHVPPGKLHTEREVPVDELTRRILQRILLLRVRVRPSCPETPPGFLLPRRHRTHQRWEEILSRALARAAHGADCTPKVTPHRLRHTFATTMVRLGVSLPALMQLLGHNDIRMTMRYVQVTQQDLQREFYRASHYTTLRHPLPKLPLSLTTPPPRPDLVSIRDLIVAATHLLQTFRLDLQDSKASSKLHRLAQRLRKINQELEYVIAPENGRTLAGQ
jgi:site-specific recombinase XerD